MIMATDMSEKGLESLIFQSMTGESDTASAQEQGIAELPGVYTKARWIAGRAQDYHRDYAVDVVQLEIFLRMTQPQAAQALALDSDSPARQKFLARLQGEITRRGVIDVLRGGVKHGPHSIDLFYGTPSPGNARAAARFAANRFSVTRQLRYSTDESKLALDMAILINGLPIATFEFKNRLTKQTVEDAVWQYRRDRDPRELLFQFGRRAFRARRPGSAHVHPPPGQSIVVFAFQ